MSWKPDDMRWILVNPAYAITVSRTLCAPHPPTVTKQQWVQANANLIKEIGAERWLREMLDVLETGGIATEKPSK